MGILAKTTFDFAAAASLFMWPAGSAHAAGVNVYAPYEFLIGDWTSRPAGENGPTIRQSFRWGPKRSYIFYATYTRSSGQPEAVHFEGMMAWNGASRALDFLFVVEPGSGVLEQGTIRAEPDRSVVRETTLTSADGTRGTFRQVFRQDAPDRVITSLMRQTATGWVPTFPGSDRLVMTRQPVDSSPCR